MKTAHRYVLGLSVHTGWAACVVAGGSVRAPRMAAREEIEMLGDPERFVFHRAEEMDRASAPGAVAGAKAQATERATAAVKRVVERVRAAEGDVVACAIVAKGGAMRALDEILAAHPRIHTAEGCFYRDVLAVAAEANRLATKIVSPKDLEAAAAAAMGVRPADLPALLAEAGRTVGRPWTKDQKMASLAAWMILA